jgi:uncharacterized membrane protein YsdA (DUF1294 family)/cold shock CspA family protein
MRYQGKIFDWKDEQGYGLVMPNGGGQKAFVHIKNYFSQTRRPANGDLITYELLADDKRRFYANNILPVGKLSKASTTYKQYFFTNTFAITFCVILVLSVLIGGLPSFILWLYLVVSVVTFIAYALDKQAAKNRQWRRSEKTLHVLALIGGWPGALVAQKMFRHKTIKKEFQIIFWATVVLNALVIFWLLLSEDGGALLRSISS